MRGLAEYFFYIVFIVGFARLFLEIFFKPRNSFLMQVSIGLMAVSALMIKWMWWLDEMEIEHQATFMSQWSTAILFFGVAFVCGFVGYLWFKKLK